MARYRLVSEKGEWRLSPGENLIGHFGHCRVQIDGPDVAGEHACVDLEGDRLLLKDLGGDAGTFVGDERVESAMPLAAGTAFRVGGVTFRVARSRDLRQLIRGPAARRAIRIAAKVALGLLAALVILLVALPLIYDAESFRQDAIEALEAALSRDAEIGEVEFKLFRGRTELSDVVVHNLPEFGGEPLVKVPRVRASFHTGRYLGSLGRSLRADVTLDRPVLMLERNDRGRWNVGDLCRAVVGAVRGAREESVWWVPYSELELHVRAVDATVRVRDDFAGETREITGVTFEADLPSLDGELTYRLAAGVPVAGRPGKVVAKGRLTLFEGGGLSAGSVRGEVFSLNVKGLDLRAVPGLPRGTNGPLAGALPVDEADLDVDISAESLESCRARVEARLWGGGAEGGPKVTVSADLAGSVLPLALERGEVTARGPGWDLSCQGRAMPAKLAGNGAEPRPAGGAEALDVDATLRADVGLLDGLRRWFPLLSAAPLEGKLVLKLSTTGPTRELDVSADARVEGLVCPGTGALPEDVSASLRGTVGLLGWSTLDAIRVKSFAAEASFLQASVAPGEVCSIARPREARARIGPIEFDVDLAELGHRYGPLFAFRPLDSRVHGWAELSGEGGRLVLRHAAYSRAGATAEGTTALVFPPEGRPRAEVEWRFSEPAGLSVDLRGRTALAGPEPEFDVAFSASGGLARVLEV
ncbi:MAG: FHA domain-containing protein, partial [Planctomycetota bacterium]